MKYITFKMFGTNIPEIQSHLIGIMLKHVYFPVLVDGMKNIHSNSIQVSQSKDRWAQIVVSMRTHTPAVGRIQMMETRQQSLHITGQHAARFFHYIC